MSAGTKDVTPMKAVTLIIRRELHERTRQKSFFWSTGITLAIVLALAIIPGLSGDDGPTTYDVGIVTTGGESQADPPPLAGALERVNLGDDTKVKTRLVADRDEARRLVDADDLDAAVDGDAVIVKDKLNGELEALLQIANRDLRTQQALAAAGVSEEEGTAITDPPPLEVVPIEPPNSERDERRTLVTFGVFIVLSQLFAYGFAVASSVVEEKASRVVELILAKIRPSYLLAGKIVGVGALGFGQLVLYFAVGLAAATAAGSIELPPGLPAAGVLVLGWFVLGFTFYAALFAMAGAIASRVEELQNTTAPITFVLMGGYLAAIITAGDPGGPVARATSYLPFSAPMVMPIRMAAGEASVVELVVSVVVVLASVAIVVRIAGRVYSGGALRLRRRVKLREALAGGE